MNKITVISYYYFPEDTAIGLYSTQMVAYLVNRGYEVNVITGFPNYPQWKIQESYKNKKTFFKEIHDRVKIYRYKTYIPSQPTFIKRIVSLIDFTLGSLFNIIKIKECDLVISVVPFTSTALLGWILKMKKNAVLWNHIQDFEFDAAIEAGFLLRKNIFRKIACKLLYSIEQFIFNKGSINSTISHRMLEKLQQKTRTKTYYFPNWIDINQINPVKSKTHEYLEIKPFKILYSGNIGDKQDWNFLLEFSKKVCSLDVQIIIVGDGAKKQWLLDKISELKNIAYRSPVPYRDLSDLLCSADLHILFQKNNIVDSVMPSKLLGMMASSRPSLVVGNLHSEVRKIIKDSNGGFYLAEQNLESCFMIVKDLMNHPQKRAEMGTDARKYVMRNFSYEKVLTEFEKELSKLIQN